MEYLTGVGIAAIVWLALYLSRRDLRRDMLWSGYYYSLVMTLGFAATKIFLHVPLARTINPGYWAPTTLFDLDALTNGFSIEDLLFMFFVGGIAAVIYESLRPHVRYRHLRHRPHNALAVGIIAAILVACTPANLIYSLIAFGFAGAAVVWIERPDLIRHSIIGGAIFLGLYTAIYLIVLVLYPNFVAETYRLQATSGVLVFGIPLEEYLFALGFGLLWSPIYEYVKDLKN